MASLVRNELSSSGKQVDCSRLPFDPLDELRLCLATQFLSSHTHTHLSLQRRRRASEMAVLRPVLMHRVKTDGGGKSACVG